MASRPTTTPETDTQTPSIAPASEQLGALDLGSNSFHLLVACENDGRMQVVDKHREMVRLAEGLQPDGGLDDEVQSRALACLERLAQRLRNLHSDNVRIVGTNTLRKAAAAGDFVAKAEAILGHKIEIISGREEARLIYQGVCHDLGTSSEQRLVVDIGGGSTELIVGKQGTPNTLESLYMGCVSMSQQHFGDGLITQPAFDAARDSAAVELEPVAEAFLESTWDTAVGASGTINAVSQAIMHLTGQREITKEGLEALRIAMIARGHTDSLDISGIATERRRVFPGGVAILSAVFDALHIESMSFSQSALREGLIYDLMGRVHHDDLRDHTVKALTERFHINLSHARRVRETALSLLAQVAIAWDLTQGEHKHLLGWAATLHEIGMDIAHSGYHKHGGYLLENMDMPGFSRSDQSLLAVLVRAHRRKLPSELKSQSEWLRLVVLLRLASVIHRGRGHQAIPHVGLSVSGDEITVSFETAWLDGHPLTRLDMETEQDYLAAAGLTLNIADH